MAWQPYLKALGLVILGAVLGGLWVQASWVGVAAPHTNWLGNAGIVVAGMIVLGMVLQRWTSAGEAAGVAAAFLAGAFLVSMLADSSDEGWGRVPLAGLWAVVFVGIAVTCALVGHALAAALLGRRLAGSR